MTELVFLHGWSTIDRMMHDGRQRVYDAAFSFIGVDASPKDYAPDDFGCAESLSAIIKKAFPEMRFPTLLSTKQLYDYFERSPSFERIDAPKSGVIILSVTGTGNGKVKNGHTGVIGRYISYDGSQWIMGNDSRNGLWSVNYTVKMWRFYYETKGGMPTLFYKIV